MLRIPDELLKSQTNESLAEILSDLPDEQAQEWLSQLPDEEQEWLSHSWQFWGRPKQQPPDRCADPECGCGGDWTTWLILSGRAWGKALATDTPIPTVSGWKAMGDIVAGDVLFDENGKQTRVTHAFDVMLGRPCRCVVFSDGAEIVADDDHEWVTFPDRNHGVVRSTADISESLSRMRHWVDADRYIVSADRCESVPVRCIKVDSPSSLFLASRAMIPTHNSRTGSEWVHEVAHKYPGSRIAVVAPTARSARQVMIEGESGILGTQKPWNKCRYWPAKLEITFANGSLCGIFSADEPERLRGPQHHFAWCDELCAWPKADDVWNMLRLGLRLPARSGWPKYAPRVVITTTPKPTELIRKLAGATAKGKSKRTHVTRGSTYENKSNLDRDYFDSVISDLKGTRLGQQELYGAILLDTPGALWRSAMIDPFRVDPEQLPLSMKNCVIAVDPSAGGDNETGIVACASGPPPIMEGVDLEHLDDHPSIAASLKKNQRMHGYVLADCSIHGATPDQWARAAVRAYHEFDAACIVAESNQGGDMVRYTINTVDSSVPVRLVHATRGKKTRAEPVAALFEQGRIHIVGRLTKLEEQLLTWDPEEGKSPDRLDAMVWGLHHLLGKGKIHYNATPVQVGVRPNPWAIIP